MATKAPRKAYKPLFESAIRKAQRLVNAVREANDAKALIYSRIEELTTFIENETDESFKSPAPGSKVPVKKAAAVAKPKKKAKAAYAVVDPAVAAQAAAVAAKAAKKAAKKAEKKFVEAKFASAAPAAAFEAEDDDEEDDDDEDADESDESDGDDSEVVRNLKKDMDECAAQDRAEADAGC
jgi:hypothetical protein